MFRYFERTNWQSAYEFLTYGSPSLIVQLLMLNTIFLMLFVFRRVLGKTKRKNNASNAVQMLLIMANAAVLLQSDFLPYARMAFANFRIL